MSNETKCPTCGGHRGLRRMTFNDIDNPVECADPWHNEAALPVPVEEEKVVDFPSPAAPAPVPPQGPMVKPKCPYCLQEGNIKGAFTNLGPLRVMVIRCGNDECAKIFSVIQPLQMEVVQPPPGGFPN